MFLAVASTDPLAAQGVAASWSAPSDLSSFHRLGDGSLAIRLRGEQMTHVTGSGELLIAGRARLDRPELEDGGAPDDGPASLQRLLDGYRLQGSSVFSLVTGEFAVVLWNTQTGELIAARDPLGLEPLYYCCDGETCRVSDDLAAFDRETTFDKEFFADFISRGGVSRDRTVWANVRPVPGGSLIRWQRGQLTRSRYWSGRVTGRRDLTMRDAATRFRSLLERAVLRELQSQGKTWSHLSGGLDSSSIVSTAALLGRRGHTPHRLGGTITMVESLGDHGDSGFAREVASAWEVPNLTVHDDWPWRDDGEPPPLTAGPVRDYPFYARDRSIRRLVHEGGGARLLTGAGPDLYLPVTAAHVPDLIWTLRIGEALSELHRWTLSTRRSVWDSAVSQMIVPLLSPRRAGGLGMPLPRSASWLNPRFVREYGLADRAAGYGLAHCERGRLYDSHVERQLSDVSGYLPTWWAAAPGLEMRHPFLHRPLVDFVLELPYRLRTDAHQTKPLLRSAMTGVLPERVRTRVGKGTSLSQRVCWALAKERRRLQRIVGSSILGECSCIEPARLMTAIDDCARGRSRESAFVYAALSLETWLSVTAGRSLEVAA